MTLQHYYNGTILTGTAVLVEDERGFSARATIGQVDTSSIYIEDPTATLDFVPYKSWTIREDACAIGSQVVWHGYVGDTTISRLGGVGQFRTTVGRRWTIELIEDNGWPSRRVITATSGNRPSETVSARITWVLTVTGMTGIIFDHGLIETSSTVMDAVDYRNRTSKDVLDDCALLSGYNWFVRYREASNDIELIFQSTTSTADPTTLKISNVNAEINLVTVWPPNPAAEQRFGASRIASGILLPYSGGTDYNQDAATAAAFGAVDQTAPTSAVKTKTAARAQITRLLAQHNEQDESIENVVLTLPAARLNDVRHGQLITSAKFGHFKGTAATGTYARVKSKSFGRPSEITQDWYDVGLSLSPYPAPAALFRALLHHESGFYSAPTPLYNPDGSEVVTWTSDGDTPEAGWSGEPSSGYASGVAATGSGSAWRGIRVTRWSVVRIDHTGGFGGVANTGATVTVAIRRSGTVISTQTQTYGGTGGTFQGAFNFALTNIAAAPGDTFEVSVVEVGWAGFQYYARTLGEFNSPSHFRVTAP